MGRSKPQPQTEAVILPPDFDDEDDQAGGGIPDDDGWIHLERKEPADGEEKPKRKPRQRRD
jgi:hypothetical protein